MTRDVNAPDGVARCRTVSHGASTPLIAHRSTITPGPVPHARAPSVGLLIACRPAPAAGAQAPVVSVPIAAAPRLGPDRRRTRCIARPPSTGLDAPPGTPGAAAARLADARPGNGCWHPPGAADSARSTAGRRGLGPGRTACTARRRDTWRGRGACRPVGGAGRRCGRFACAVRRQRIPDRSTRGRRCPAARRTWCTRCPAGES